jgi:hypothetical protein
MMIMLIGHMDGATGQSYWPTNNEVTHQSALLSQARSALTATTIGNYAIFAGGQTRPEPLVEASNVVDLFDISTMKMVEISIDYCSCISNITYHW